MMKLDDFRSGTPTVKTLCYWLTFLMAQPWILAGSAWGAYSDETASRLPLAIDDSYNFAVADVDGINGPDVLVANRGQSRLLMNDGSGSFTDETASRLPSLLHTTLAVEFADVDGANGPDAILVGDGQNRIYMNDGSGVFSDETGTRMPTAQRVTIDVAVDDVDGDGDPDMVIANRRSSNRLLINNGAGVFTDESGARLPTDMDLTYGVALGDADDSGSVDIFFANFAGQNRLLINNNLGFFADESGARLPVATNTTGGATFIDADGDGDPDIATAEGGNGVGLLLNTAGVFADAPGGSIPAFNEFAIRARAADVDFNGSEDLLIATMGQDRLFINDGSGVFSDATGTELPADDRRSFGARLFDADADFDLDALAATPQGQNRFLDNQMAGPRIIIDISPGYIEVTDPVTIDLTVFDENGVDTTVLEVIQPTQGSVVVPIVSDTGTFTPSETGVHTVRVTATDIGANSSVREAFFDAQPADVTAPLIALSVNPTAVTQGEFVDFVVTASDDRAVDTLTLTVGGVNVPLDNAGMATFAPSALGSLAVIATATDARGNSASASSTLNVAADTEDPVVSLSATPDPVDITNPISVSASATDNINVSSFGVTVTGPGGNPTDAPVNLDGSGNGSYTPFLPGDYVFTASASDAAGNSDSTQVSVTAIGVPDVELPVVTLSIVPAVSTPGNIVTITVNATDNIFVASRTLTVNGAPLTLDGANQAQYTPPVLGDYTIVGTATDPTGNTGTDSGILQVVDPSTDNEAPVVAITTPGEGDEITGSADIIGTATDLTLVSYELSYRPAGVGAFIPFAMGNQVVENGVLGTFNTTTLENGLYDIGLSASDINGVVSSVFQTISVVGEFKPGIFSITYDDLDVPVSGIPITIKRTYDSRRRARSGDFGNGWYLEVVQDGTYVNNRPLGDGWSRIPASFGLACATNAQEDVYHITEVRFSDVEFYEFAFSPILTGGFSSLGCDVSGVSFTQVGGVPGASLQALNVPGFLSVLQGNLIDIDTFIVYDPQDVRLTTLDGRQYDLNLQAGLKRIGDNNGNSIFINSNGVTHSNGKSISFVRDGTGRITRITDPLGRNLDYTYDGAGNLVTSADRAGNTTSYAYIANSYLSEITDPLGNMPLRNEYDADGLLIAQIDALGSRTEFDNDVDAGTQTITDRDGTVTVLQFDTAGKLDSATIGSTTSTFTHDASGNKLTETDADGNTTTWTYDALDRPLSQTDAGGNVTAFAYVGDNMSSITDHQGNVLALTYDASGNLTEQRDAGGNLMQGFAYDGDGNVTQLTLASGATTLTYDTSGNPISLTSPGGRLETYTYDANGNIGSSSVDRTQSSGGAIVRESTSYTYDNNGSALTVTNPLGNVTTYTYDANQRKASETNALGNTTDFSYDSRGNLSRIDHPDGTFEAFGYDLTNRLTAHTDRGSNTTFFEYDNNDRLTRTIYPDGSSLTSGYSAGGDLLTETDGRGNTTTYTRDTIGRVLTRTDAAGAVTTYTYTADQINPTTETDALGRVTTYAYNDDMLMTEYLVQTTLPGSVTEQQTWGPNSRRTSSTDANGNTTTYAYDAAGNLTSVTDAAGGVTTYTYDELGNRLTQVDAEGRTTTFTYDALGRMLSKLLPGGAGESWTYDAVGNLLTHNDFIGAVTSYTYDSMGRRLLTTFPGGATEAYTYTAKGELATVTRGSDVTSFTYDARGRVASSATPDGITLTYTYDNAGNRITVGGLGTSTFTYDSVDRLATVAAPGGDTTTYTYDNVGNITQIDYPNSTRAALSYNARNQTVDVTHLAPDLSTVLSSYAYSMDAVGNRTNLVANGQEIDYAYDALNRLVQVIDDPSGAALTTGYAYDDVGNILTFADPGGTDTYTYDVNDRILTGAGRSYGYDANGNLLQVDADGSGATTDDITSFVYDSLNRLVERTESDGTVTVFQYDFEGNRVARTVNGSTTQFVNDNNDPSGLSRVLRERDGGGTTVADYTYGHGLLAMDRAGTDSYFHTDALGSIGALTSSAGAVSDSYSYDAYGNIVLATGSTANEYGFAGGRQDPSTGMYHLGARYFDPEVARFISRDPFPGLPEQPATQHPYQYALNNPVNMIDPNGEFSAISISISISIVSTLSSIAFNSYKTGKDVSDKLTDLLVTIPGLKLNKDAAFESLGLILVDTNDLSGVEELTDIVRLGGGAVEKSYSVVYSMTSLLGKVVSLVHARNSALWMRGLPRVDGKPAHYLSCDFNAYVQKTFTLSQVTSLAKGGKLKVAATIIGAWLAYFNFLVLVIETVNDTQGTVHPTSCPAIPAA